MIRLIALAATGLALLCPGCDCPSRAEHQALQDRLQQAEDQLAKLDQELAPYRAEQKRRAEMERLVDTKAREAIAKMNAAIDEAFASKDIRGASERGEDWKDSKAYLTNIEDENDEREAAEHAKRRDALKKARKANQQKPE